MLLSESLLLILVGTGIIVSPIYLYLRSKMTSSNKPRQYSKKTIFRVVGMHFLLVFTVTVLNVIILQALLEGSQLLTQRAIFVISIQVLCLAAALYGSGIYITAILFETFVTRKYLVIRFLHGPLSHMIIYISCLVAFANLSFISNAIHVSTSTELWQIFLILGVLAGIVAVIDNIANGILLLSLASSALIFGIFLFFNSQMNSFAHFFIGLEVGLLLGGALFIVQRLLNGKKLSWYEPINIF